MWAGRLFGVVVVAVLAWVGYGFWQPLNLSHSYRLEVEPGSTLYRVTEQLGAKGIVRTPLVLLLYEHLFYRQARIYAGVYPLDSHMNGLDLLAMLTDSPGRYVQRLTVVEGSTLMSMSHQIQALQAQGLLKNDLEASPEAWQAFLQEPGPSLEGWLAPDTYGFVPGMSTQALLRLMYVHQQHILQNAWLNRAPDLPYRNPYAALIMASIIEKETGQPEERPHIAGVFINRLGKHMRLQTDPTVIYGMGATYHGKITHKELQAWTPYNTYRIDGLPPTPIAMPGRASIWAALHPEVTPDLYFVARGDGTHRFSATLDEQNEAVQHYQKHRQEGYHAHP